ncbi:UNVERIFIED_CONTAM: hypothetical protein NCL1_09327 [Trichonephila clavipes]
MASLAVDGTAAKSFFSHSLYAPFVTQGIFNVAHGFLADEYPLLNTRIPQINCKFMALCLFNFSVDEKGIMKSHLEHFTATLEKPIQTQNLHTYTYSSRNTLGNTNWKIHLPKYLSNILLPFNVPFKYSLF